MPMAAAPVPSRAFKVVDYHKENKPTGPVYNDYGELVQPQVSN